MTDEMQTRDRADVRQLSDWIDREIANGATEIELHDTRSSTVLGMWGGSALDLAEESALVLAEEIVDSAEADLDRLASATVLAIAANEPPRIVEIARARTVLVVARGPSGIATLRLEIANDAAEPAPDPSAAVLRHALRRIDTLVKLHGSSTTSTRWLLLERLVDILLATDARVERLADELEAPEIASLAELLAQS